ncbi:hypothetical protein PENTCL1PPCAC_13624, partial [Pristionchus entomophagus]
HIQDLGPDAADLMQMTIASTKKVTREEPSIARLLCTIMEKRQGEEAEWRCSNVDISSTPRRKTRERDSNASSDGAAISKLWSRAHSWTHMLTCLEAATKLMIECDRWV